MALELRPLTLDDTTAVHGWARLPESCRYQVWGPNTYEQTQAYVKAAVAAAPGRLVFAVLVDGEVVGSADLRLHGPNAGEIAYAVHPRPWGQGSCVAAADRRTGGVSAAMRAAHPVGHDQNPGGRHNRPPDGTGREGRSSHEHPPSTQPTTRDRQKEGPDRRFGRSDPS